MIKKGFIAGIVMVGIVLALAAFTGGGAISILCQAQWEQYHWF